MLRLGLQDFIVILSAVTLTLLQFNGFADDPGVGWHLATGEFIVEHKQIPDYDPFLASKTPRTWVSDQWLADVIFSATYARYGWKGLYASLAAVYFITYFGILYWGVLRGAGVTLAASISVFLAFKIGQLHFILRPVMFGFFLFALVYALLYRIISLSREDEERAIGLIWPYIVLPIIFTLWANLHPSFILGLGLIGLVPCGLLFDRVFFARHFSLALVLRMVVLGIFCAAATFINPYGADLHESIFKLSNSTYFMSLNEEWLSTSFKSFEGELVLYIIGLILASLFLAGAKKLRWGFFEFSVLVVFGSLGLKSVRILPFFGIVASVPLALALANLGNAAIAGPSGYFRVFSRLLRGLELRERSTTRGYVALAIVVGLLAYGAMPLSARSLILFDGPYGPSAAKFPENAISFLKDEVNGPPTTVLAPPEWGGAITFFGRGKVKAIIDDRNTLLGEQFYKDFYSSTESAEELIKFARRVGASKILLHANNHIHFELEHRADVDFIYGDEISTVATLQPLN